MQAPSGFFDRAFSRYAATSALATATDFALASALHAIGSSAAVATFFGCVAGGLVSFRLSRGWTFEAGAGSALSQLWRFLFVWATSALLNSSGVPLLLRWVSSFPLAWALVRAAVYLGWNYPLARWFVFGAPKAASRLSAR
ncbi:MAG TPA: GtrA family protein [Polyangiaceae bacterium]|nr:GtrA family protein [Polyangiaceae bacterium]